MPIPRNSKISPDVSCVLHLDVVILYNLNIIHSLKWQIQKCKLLVVACTATENRFCANSARLIDEMRKLVERFPKGYEAPEMVDMITENEYRDTSLLKSLPTGIRECVA